MVRRRPDMRLCSGMEGNACCRDDFHNLNAGPSDTCRSPVVTSGTCSAAPLHAVSSRKKFVFPAPPAPTLRYSEPAGTILQQYWKIHINKTIFQKMD